MAHPLREFFFWGTSFLWFYFKGSHYFCFSFFLAGGPSKRHTLASHPFGSRSNLKARGIPVSNWIGANFKICWGTLQPYGKTTRSNFSGWFTELSDIFVDWGTVIVGDPPFFCWFLFFGWLPTGQWIQSPPRNLEMDAAPGRWDIMLGRCFVAANVSAHPKAERETG